MSKIDRSSDASWSQEWIKTAADNQRRAEDAVRCGHLTTARHNWLRALNYYHAAATPSAIARELLEWAVTGMRQCAVNVLKLLSPEGELVTVPWREDFPLQAYFVPSGRSGSEPVVICVGEPGTRKEELLGKYVNHASQRGLALMVVDFLGDDLILPPDRLAATRSLSGAIGHVVDFLSAKPGVDPDRIAIVADAWSSSDIAQAVADESRFAAAVCDAGLWDWHARGLLAEHALGDSARPSFKNVNLIAKSIAAPLLVTAGANGWLQTDTLSQFRTQLAEDHPDATFKLFAESASCQGHMDNPTLANEVIFDWLSDRLQGATSDCKSPASVCSG